MKLHSAPMLEERVVAVTGAGRGIGLEIALFTARDFVLTNDDGAAGDGSGADSSAEAVVAEFESAGGKARTNGADISDSSELVSVIEDEVKLFGQIDAVIEHAGILRDSIFHRFSLTDWNAVIDINLNGYFYVARAVVNFREQCSGSYVNFTSTSALLGNIGQSNHAAAKIGVRGLSKSPAHDLQRALLRRLF